jgi:AraC family transcriptional regulator of adaptative response/methylated-DNA-[protein]-cysteine methyltransferase
MLSCRTIDTPLGLMTAAASDRGLCLLGFGDLDANAGAVGHLEAFFGQACRSSDHPVLEQSASELDRYFAGTLRTFAVPLDLPGTPWQRRVWEALCGIPFGETVSYGGLAAALGTPGGSRAVGLANGRNRVAVIVPCHRVIAGNGTLHGYAGGIDRKRRLLELEARHAGLFASA